MTIPFDAPTSGSEDRSEEINAITGGFNKAMGIRFVRATIDEVVAELEVGPVHKQPFGIVHGGVHAALVEAVASVGASLHAMQRGQVAIGLENHTSFLHAVREGTLRATGRPLSRGKKSQVWEGAITDSAGRLVATGRVRLIVLDQDASIAGETVEVKT
jgi:1,4-dihydroxy-2-naphthoyl-CoA hydrolase